MVRLGIVDREGRGEAGRAEALRRARETDDARAALDAVVGLLRQAEGELNQPPPDAFWDLLERAYLALDRYLARLLAAAAIEPRCGPRCSTCCTDTPPIFAVEALRLARALRGRADADARLACAVAQDRALGELLRDRGAPAELGDPRYREAQLEWRRRGHRCPILDDEGSCSAYAARPLACRVHVHVHDPARCHPDHPAFSTTERPPLWGHPREAEVELALIRISEALGLTPTMNLQAGLARLSRHPSLRPGREQGLGSV